ncbi:MAG: methyltransferase domain-containing protein [Alphaproteobacteria bacterium]
MTDRAIFTKDDGHRLPVSDDFLIPFLSPTSPGTNYWDPPPPGKILDRQRGRIVLQFHQILHLLTACGLSLEGKRLLDIGTGNGMIPRLLLEFSELEAAVGIDPYLSGEHKTSWQAHDQDEEFRDIRDFVRRSSPGALDYDKYRGLTRFEHHAIHPGPVAYGPSRAKTYRFHKIGAHDLGSLGETFDLFYVKALDHIPDWNGVFAAAAAASAADAHILIKHFSFFSFLGPHRYATTNIPWGHLLLTDDEYRRFARDFHGPRADAMIEFYFTGLSYPRTTLSGMIGVAQRNGFAPRLIINEPLRNVTEVEPLIDRVDDFWSIVRANHPDVGFDEMVSGRYHILFRKTG